MGVLQPPQIMFALEVHSGCIHIPNTMAGQKGTHCAACHMATTGTLEFVWPQVHETDTCTFTCSCVSTCAPNRRPCGQALFGTSEECTRGRCRHDDQGARGHRQGGRPIAMCMHGCAAADSWRPTNYHSHFMKYLANQSPGDSLYGAAGVA
jgi:hypothetical protein